MKLEIKTFQQLLNQNEISSDVQGCLNKKWVSLDHLEKYIDTNMYNGELKRLIMNDIKEIKK